MTVDPLMEKTFTERPHYGMAMGAMLPAVPLADVNDISDAVVYLASDLSRAVTGTQLTVDMGATKV